MSINALGDEVEYFYHWDLLKTIKNKVIYSPIYSPDGFINSTFVVHTQFVMVKFILKEKNSIKETPIRMHCFYDGVEIIISTGYKILVKNWAFDKQRITNDSSKVRNGGQMNGQLKELRRVAEEVYTDIQGMHKKVTTEMFRELYKRKLYKGTTEKDTSSLFVASLTQFIEKEEALKGKVKVSMMVCALSILKKFDKYADTLSFEEFDLKYCTSLIDHMTYKEGYSINYIGSIISQLKSYMHLTFNEKIHKNSDFFNFPAKKVSVFTVSLSPEEVEAIRTVPLVGNKINRIRDLFIIQCNTGLRFGDASKLTLTNVQGSNLEVTTSKTNREVVIPMNSVVREICDRYKGFPANLYISDTDVQLKVIAKEAKLFRKVKVTKKLKGKLVSVNKQLCDVISSHTGRRTALTNMYRQGIPLEKIRYISGHSTIKQLLAYIKVDSKENVEELQVHPFFQ